MLPRPPGTPAPPGAPPSMSQVGASAGAGAPPGGPPGAPPPQGGGGQGGAFSPQDMQKLAQVLTPDVAPLILKIAGAGMIDAFQTVMQHMSQQQSGAPPGGPAAAAPASPAPGAPPNMPTGASGQPLQ